MEESNHLNGRPFGHDLSHGNARDQSELMFSSKQELNRQPRAARFVEGYVEPLFSVPTSLLGDPESMVMGGKGSKHPVECEGYGLKGSSGGCRSIRLEGASCD